MAALPVLSDRTCLARTVDAGRSDAAPLAERGMLGGMVCRVLAVCSLVYIVVAVTAGVASAHNTLVSSDPADGAVLAEAPTELVLTFDLPVPLDTVSATWTGESGVRTEIPSFRHATGDGSEVVAALPPELGTRGTARWRLVGPDGHPISGRIQFSVGDTTAAAAGVSATTSAAGPVAEEDEVQSSVAAWVRWVLRYASYVAIAVVGGIVSASLLVWRTAWEQPLLRRIVAAMVGTVAAAALAQVLVLASDIAGTAPWSALGAVLTALGTDAGAALALRIVMAVALAVLLFTGAQLGDRLRWGAVVVLLGGLLATWAYAGHASALRYPWAGVPLDVLHHAAVSVWVGGLVVVGAYAVRKQEMAELVTTINRFATVAGIAVAVIVATGVGQTLRLVEAPADLWRADHGRLLVVKVVLLAAMLKVADVNRRRVARHFKGEATVGPRVVRNLGRAMMTEFGVGLAVIAVTAVMVVSPPASAQWDSPPAVAIGQP
jgi:copper transport protein